SASPTEVRLNTTRLDTNNRFSYPTKVAFLDLTPYVAQRETFYTKTKETSRYNIIRSIFQTGATLSTKFYRTFDVSGNVFGMEINKLRHIITPQIDYQYIHTPSFPSTELDTFDTSIDSITKGDSLIFSLENRFQTKRNGQNVDFLRIIGKSDFLLKGNPGPGSFNTVTSDIEFRPVDWLTFYSDTNYSAQTSKLSTANFDIYINGGQKWALSLSRRLEVEGDDMVTTDLTYRLNPKWKFRLYDRFDVGGGGQKEQGYTVTRDLHCWEMDINYNETRGQGSEIWVVFRVKAFPDSAIDLFGTSFNRRKSGSQLGP
ncbi:MAG: LPS assembly protein LptD, partial [Candidatus Omnitrophica bacterium]|nr:LPS assembly protein LptD [Candidatus Omnitrophota bacterium]